MRERGEMETGLAEDKWDIRDQEMSPALGPRLCHGEGCAEHPIQLIDVGGSRGQQPVPPLCWPPPSRAGPAFLECPPDELSMGTPKE